MAVVAMGVPMPHAPSISILVGCAQARHAHKCTCVHTAVACVFRGRRGFLLGPACHAGHSTDNVPKRMHVTSRLMNSTAQPPNAICTNACLCPVPPAHACRPISPTHREADCSKQRRTGGDSQGQPHGKTCQAWDCRAAWEWATPMAPSRPMCFKWLSS
jgi:hypothetical protein